MGIDPGSRITGYAFLGVNSSRSGTPRLLEFGVVRVSTNQSHALRLRVIFDALQALLEKHRPADVAVEAVFHAKNARAALLLGQARGAALAAVGERGVRVFEYSPLAIKKTVTGYGRASKEQVQHMVHQLLHLDSGAAPNGRRSLERMPQQIEGLPSDAADAAAVALCHAAHRASRERGLL